MNQQFENSLKLLEERKLLTYAVSKPLSACGSFRIGGPVDYAVYPVGAEGVKAVLSAAENFGESVRVVGGGTNILFPDQGYGGAIVFTSAMNKVTVEGEKIRADAGVSLCTLALRAQRAGLSGLEFVYGIPGSVGGGIYMNAGAYEHTIGEVLEESTYLCAENGEIGRLQSDEHRFGYRHSVYMEFSCTILEGVFRLIPDDENAIKTRMDEYMQRRKSKQPLDFPSAGSVFKRYPGYFTGKLIEDSGLKGYTIGGARVSTKHAGFIINIGGATAEDVKRLVSHIEETIYRNYGIHIERELIYF